MRYWLKLGYYTDTADEGDASYWEDCYWVSDSPGRRSPRWNTRARPRSAQEKPPYGPRYAVGDKLVIYVKGRGCPAILQVTALPRWDPKLVDEEGGPGEGDRWGVVTDVKSIGAVALSEAPGLADLSVSPTSVMQKGHIELEEWQYLLAAKRIGMSTEPVESATTPEVRHMPIERIEVDGYEVAPSTKIRRAIRREALLVTDYKAHLESLGDDVGRISMRPTPGAPSLYSDVFNRSRDQLIEAKAGSTRNEVRMAIGQLADYGRFTNRRTRKAVLLDVKPHPDLLALLETQGIAVVWRDRDGFSDSAGGEFV